MGKKHSLLPGPYSEYIVLIRTNSYAGNFEREMCAFCTGVTGECGVGEEYAEQFRREVDEETAEAFDDIVQQVADDNGCRRPCALSANTTCFEIFFYSRPTDVMLLLIRERALRFAEEETPVLRSRSHLAKRETLRITGFRLIRKDVTFIEEPFPTTITDRKPKRKRR